MEPLDPAQILADCADMFFPPKEFAETLGGTSKDGPCESGRHLISEMAKEPYSMFRECMDQMRQVPPDNFGSAIVGMLTGLSMFNLAVQRPAKFQEQLARRRKSAAEFTPESGAEDLPEHIKTVLKHMPEEILQAFPEPIQRMAASLRGPALKVVKPDEKPAIVMPETGTVH